MDGQSHVNVNCEQADKGSQLILVVLCLNLGCAGFKKYRRDKIAE